MTIRLSAKFVILPSHSNSSDQKKPELLFVITIILATLLIMPDRKPRNLLRLNVSRFARSHSNDAVSSPQLTHRQFREEKRNPSEPLRAILSPSSTYPKRKPEPQPPSS